MPTSPPKLFRIWLNSIAYTLGLVVSTPIFALLACLILPLPARTRYAVISCWARIMLTWLRLTCGLNYRVHGLENAPQTPCVVLCKHQSGWETMALQLILPPQVWLLKRELLWIPFFGWGLRALSPIAIDRQKAKQAALQMVRQGRDRIQKGFWIIIFPEGSRVPVGQKGEYKRGGAHLALDLQVPVLPIAHNAGVYWPKNSFLKYPGIIEVHIGAPLLPTDYSNARQLNQATENWIETQMQTLPQTR